MAKLDLTRQFKSYYTAAKKPEVVNIDKAQYLSIEGKGDPSGEAFRKTIQALYPVAYALKFAFKSTGQDFIVGKLEGLWWYDESRYPDATIDSAPQTIPRSEWKFRLLIRIPDFVKAKDVQAAVDRSFKKKRDEEIGKVSLFELEEGQCVQMLHTGPFDTEPATLAIMMDFMTEHRLARNGRHHEIYLSDFRKTPPEKLRTILREPVR